MLDNITDNWKDPDEPTWEQEYESWIDHQEQQADLEYSDGSFRPQYSSIEDC